MPDWNWQEIEQHPNYQNRDPIDQREIRRQFFNEVVMADPEFQTMLPEEQMELETSFIGPEISPESFKEPLDLRARGTLETGRGILQQAVKPHIDLYGKVTQPEFYQPLFETAGEAMAQKGPEIEPGILPGGMPTAIAKEPVSRETLLKDIATLIQPSAPTPIEPGILPGGIPTGLQDIGGPPPGPGQILQDIIRPNVNVLTGAAGAFNRAMASFSNNLDKLSTAVSEMTGFPKGGVFEAATQEYAKNADYWNKKLQDQGFTEEVMSEFIGGAGPGMAEFMLNLPYATALGYVEEGAKGAAKGAAKRLLLGQILHATNVLKTPERMAAMGTVGATQAATEGAEPKEIAKSAGVMAGFGALGAPGEVSVKGKIQQRGFEKTQKAAREWLKQEREQKPAAPEAPERPIAEEPIPKSGEIEPEKIPLGKIVPKRIEVPIFKSTDEAIEFGRQATPEQIEQLKAARAASLQEQQTEATNSQFYREAIAAAEGKIKPREKLPAPPAVPKAPEKPVEAEEKPSEIKRKPKEPWHEYERRIAENIYVEMDRFAHGEYISRKGYIGKGDIEAAYSGDKLTDNKIRKPFEHEGKLYTNTGGFSHEGRAEYTAYQLVPVEEYKGKTHLYGKGTERFTYEGQRAKYRGKEYVLTNRTNFIAGKEAKPAPETEKMDLHDWQVAKNNELREAEKIEDPQKRIDEVDRIIKNYDDLANPNWVIGNRRLEARIKLEAKKQLVGEKEKTPEPTIEKTKVEPGRAWVEEVEPVPSEPLKYKPIEDKKRHSQILSQIEKRLEVPIRIGKFRKRVGAGSRAGIYKKPSEVIRLAKANDVPVAIHEIGHHVESLLGLPKKMPEEVRNMAYEGAKDLNREGFAEFLRYYVTEPEKARTEAPAFYKDFEKSLSTQTELQDVLVNVKNAWTEFQAAPSVQKVGSFVVRGKQRKPRMSMNQIYTEVKDNVWPIKKAVEYAEKKGATFTPATDPYIIARNFRGWVRKADQYLKYQPFQYDKAEGVKFAGKSLRETLTPVERAGEMEQLDIYLISRRAVSDPRVQKGFERILSVKDFKQAVKELEPKYGKIAEQLDKYNEQLLSFLLDSGRISKDLYESVKAKNPFYAPLYRVVNDIPPIERLGQKAGSVFNPIKRLKGSSRDIYSPTESLLYNTYVMINSAERNRLGNAIRNLAKEKGMGKFIDKVPFPVKPIKAKKQDILDAIHKQVELSKAETDALAELPAEVIFTFRPQYRARENEVIFYNKGKPELYEITDPLLYKAISNVNGSEINALVKILSYPAKWLRSGATTFSPEFGIRNPMRDQMTAWIQTKYGFTPGVDFLRGVYHMFGATKLWQEFNTSGAAHSTIVSIDRNYIAKNLKEMFKEQHKIRYLKNPLEMIQRISEFTEEATRVGEFAKARKKLGPSLESLMQSGLAAREVSLDFGRQGGITARSLNMISAFWNARLEGINKMVRTLREQPVKAATKAFLGITLPTLLLWYKQKDDPYYQELPEWRKVLFWNIVFHNADGSLKFIIPIPKPFEYGLIFGSLPEASIDWAYRKDPTLFKETAKQVGKTLDIIPMPTGAIPLMEWFANKSWFFDRPLVPRGKEDLEPVLQTRGGTSETVKLVAEVMNKVPGLKELASPAKIENLIMGYTASFGRLALDAGDWAIESFGVLDIPPDPSMHLSDLPGIRAFRVRMPSANTASIETFYKRYLELKRRWESKKQREGIRGKGITLKPGMKIAAGMPPELIFYEQVAETLTVHRKMADTVYQSKTLTPKQKDEMLTNIYWIMVNTARVALSKKRIDTERKKAMELQK